MPIFEYECTECGKRTEHLQLGSQAPLTKCPECDGKVKKLISAPAFQFKGTGWYVTDYAGKGKAPGESGGNGDKAEESGSSEPSDSKKASDSQPSSGGSKSPAKSSSGSASSPSD